MIRFTEKTWRLIRWERPPRETSLKLWRDKLHCAAGPGHRKAGKARWRDSKRVYFEYRRRKVDERRERRRIEALTPYDCGSAGSYSIPCYVVACESGYDWGAVNPSSGAFSPYQFLPSTYAGVCRICDRSREDLHRAAAEVWRRSGGSEWVCA